MKLIGIWVELKNGDVGQVYFDDHAHRTSPNMLVFEEYRANRTRHIDAVRRYYNTEQIGYVFE